VETDEYKESLKKVLVKYKEELEKPEIKENAHNKVI
jgi:hypothetical protein